jgi:hypothetical protein
MTTQTNPGRVCSKQRSRLRGLRQCVENHALRRIVRSELQQRAAAYPCHADAVIEKNRTRVVGTDQYRLQACLGEDHELRLNRDTQSVKHRFEIAERAVEAQTRCATGQLFIQPCDRILNRRAGVPDRRMLPPVLRRTGSANGGHQGSGDSRRIFHVVRFITNSV